MSHQETVPPEKEQEQQQADDLATEVPDPEVVPQAKRRQFTAKYKLRILEEADHCTERGQIGELLRREGLYSSHLSKWRQQRARGQLQGLAPKKRGRKGQDTAMCVWSEQTRGAKLARNVPVRESHSPKRRGYPRGQPMARNTNSCKRRNVWHSIKGGWECTGTSSGAGYSPTDGGDNTAGLAS